MVRQRRVQVLTDVDEARIARLRGRDEFFWLDLLAPDPRRSTRSARRSSLHPVALEDTREFGQRPKLDAVRATTSCSSSTPRARPATRRAGEPLEVHVYISGEFIATVRRDAVRRARRAARRARRGADRTTRSSWSTAILDGLTDAFYPVITRARGAGRRARGRGLTRPQREHLAADLPAQAGRARAAPARRPPSTSSSSRPRARSSASPGLDRGLAPLPARHRRPPGPGRGRVPAPDSRTCWRSTATYFNANSDRLNAVATRLTIGGTIFVAWTLVTGFFGQNFGWLVRQHRHRATPS